MLREEQKLITGSAAFADESGYNRLRSRMQSIAAFTPYSQKRVMGIVAVGILAGGLLMFGVHRVSYAHCTLLESICVFDIQSASVGNEVVYLLEDSDELREAVTFDKKNVYIDCQRFDKLLVEHDVLEREFYILFGGFQKLPGIGGCSDCVYVEYNEGTQQMIIPYQSQRDTIWTVLFRYL